MNFSKVPWLEFVEKQTPTTCKLYVQSEKPNMFIVHNGLLFFNTVYLKIAETPYSMIFHSMHEYFISPNTL